MKITKITTLSEITAALQRVAKNIVNFRPNAHYMTCKSVRCRG